MPRSRQSQISLDETPYYHACSRIVRKSWLCGIDKNTGKSYEHRREWVEQRLLMLANIYSIDVCAFAVMSNHTHIVLHVDVKQAESWSMTEVLTRWHQLYKGTLLTQNFLKGESQLSIEVEMVKSTAEIYRSRLMSISWFMRNLNEFIARAANKEDNCTGRFWEGRFKLQALLDEKALAACLAYVDLNPIRAKMAATPEESKHTSIKLRLSDLKEGKQPAQLLAFAGNPRQNMPKGLPFDFRDYCELIELTGRVLRDDKRGAIDVQQAPLLQRLGLSDENWLELTRGFGHAFSLAAGDCEHLSQHKEHSGQSRVRGIAYSHDADHSFSPKPISHSHRCRSLLLVTLR